MKSIIARPTALLIGAAMLAATFVTHQADAQSAPGDTRQMVVHYSDLNLEQPEGALRLYRRIKSAAHQVCDADGSFDFQLTPQYRRCMTNAISGAVDRVQSKQLRSLWAYDTRHGWIG